MKALYQKFETILEHTTTDFKRYLYEKIVWDNRMIGIVGPRGVGKTTLILQYIKENLDSRKALYVSADDLYFGEIKLIVFCCSSSFKLSGHLVTIIISARW